MNTLTIMKTKVCNKCGIEKDVDKFHKCRNTKDGYKYTCKECRKEDTKIYIEKNKDIIKTKIRKFRETNKGYIQTNRNYREKNRDFVLKLKKDWSKSENGKVSKQKYYENNKILVRKRVKKYRKDNVDKIKENEKKKRQTPEYRLYMNGYVKKHRNLKPHLYAWRTVLYGSLKRLGTKKEGHTIEILGYSAIELKLHMESKFKEGMSWENWGKWHIDHIKPISKFNKDEKPSVVNALDNLQPLWESENLTKSNKIIN